MSDTTSTEEQAATAPSGILARLLDNAELVIVTLLGIVSVATAYVSFQAALYDGQTAKSLSEAQSATAEAESLYLEGNQQWVQDGQTLQSLTTLQVEMESDNAELAELAQAKYDSLYFVAVSDEFNAAIERAAALTEADPEFYYSPLEDEEYQAFLFGAYADKTAEAEEIAAKADTLDAYGDNLTLSTVLMAISLFLLGVAAVVTGRRLQYGLIGIGTLIFVGAAVFAATIPFTWV